MTHSSTFLRPAALATAFAMAANMLLPAGTALAQSKQTHYLDVSAGAWYESAASALLDSGALDGREERLRPNDLATRAEMVKLLVELNDVELTYPTRPSFDDINRSAWYFPYFEAAARAGWIRGDRNCYGSHPCTGRPANNLNRAEAAALLMRAFALPTTGAAPDFSDNSNRSQWYYVPIQAAADNCVLEGDDATDRVRPASFMNRAEMIVMFDRASRNLDYGVDCGVMEPEGELISVTAASNRRVTLRFNTNIERTTADDAFRYTVSRSGQDIDVLSARIVDDRTVELTLEDDLTGDVTYTLNAASIRTSGGNTFTDSMTFRFEDDDEEPGIDEVSMRSSTMIRVQFTEDIDRTRGDDTSRYTVTRAGGGTVSVTNVSFVDDRTVDITLISPLQSSTTYLLTVNDLMTEQNEEFDDSMSFTSAGAAADLTEAIAVNATRVRLTFNTELDEGIVEERSRYLISGQNGSVAIDSATLIGTSVVELELDDDLEAQQQYTVSANNLRTDDGNTFSDTHTLTFFATNVSFTATLSGTREVPPVLTTKSGTGTFALTANGLQYDITVSGFSGTTITGAHFHRGALGVNGPVLENITFTNGRATGTWANLTPEERDDILDEEVYVNVHTSAYPDGEIRGQVER